MLSIKEGVTDPRVLNRYNSNLQETPKDRLPKDLESSFDALKQKFRETHQRIYANFGFDRSNDVENPTHRSFADANEPKPEKVVKKHRRIMSAVPKTRNQTKAIYTSEHNASTAFRNMKKMVQDRNKDVVLAKHHFNHMFDIQGDEDSARPPARLNKTGITFYSPYDNKVERTRKIENYKELIHKERIKSIVRTSQTWQDKIVKQQDFMKEKTQSISNLFEKKKVATFVESSEPHIEQDTSRSRNVTKGATTITKRKQVLNTTVGSRNNSPQRSMLTSNESAKNLPAARETKPQHTFENLDSAHKSQHYFNKKRESSRRELSSISNLLKPHNDDGGQVKEEPEEASCMSIPGSNQNRYSNSRTKLVSNNQSRRATKARPSVNLNISTLNSLSNMGRVRHNVSLNVTPSGVAAANKSFSAVPQTTVHDILSPSEYEEKLKESQDLFTKKKNKVLRHLNRTIARYNNSKQRINNKLGDVLNKISTDRTELLVDKRKVVQKNHQFSKIDFMNGNLMRKEFESSLVQRKEQTEKQIQLYETCMLRLKTLPSTFPSDKLEFLDKIKAKLEQGEYIGKDYFLSTIEKLDPDSFYWKYQEPLIIIFKNDTHINMSDYEFDKWKQRQRMHQVERKLLPLKIQYSSVSST